MIGIYKIENKVNGKLYVGSSVDIYNRWCQHINGLDSKTHKNKHLISSWHKYGEDEFEFVVIEECGSENLIEREQYWMDTLKPEYNKTKIASSRLGMFKNGADGLAQYDKWGHLVDVYVGATDAQEAVGGKLSNILKCANGERRIAYGHYWRYYWGSPELFIRAVQADKSTTFSKGHTINKGRKRSDEFVDKQRERMKGKSIPRTENSEKKRITNLILARGRMTVCLEDGIFYDCASDAARAYGLNPSHVSRVCLGNRKAIKGKKFEYV